MTDSVYKVIELIGTSSESWEKAATAATDPVRYEDYKKLAAPAAERPKCSKATGHPTA